MRNLKQHVTHENLTVSLSKKRCSSSSGVGYFDMIPVDLFINNILSRLSVKSMGKCRCVSKLWSSLIRRPNNNQLFPRRIKYSPDDIPKLLFAIEAGRKLYYFSSPHPQYQIPPDDENSSLVATLLHTHTVTDSFRLCRPVNGLVLRQCWGKNYTVAVISNPITGESVTTPKVSVTTSKVMLTMHNIESKARFYFGYDPIEEQHKVLCITGLTNKRLSNQQYHILTVETGNLSWRKIQCCNPKNHPLFGDGTCINGVLYYTAKMNKKTGTMIVVRFDVRSEKFSFINVDTDLGTKIRLAPILINYKGKLGAIISYEWYSSIELWVLDKTEEHKWSKQITYALPNQRVFLNNNPTCGVTIGVTGNGKIVFYPNYGHKDRLFIFYYSEKHVMVRVKIPGFENVVMSRVYTFPNYVEHAKLI